MADLGAQIAKAKKAGYSDAEITAYLGQDQSFAPKVAEAKKYGYSDSEIVSHLTSVAAPKPKVQQDAEARVKSTPGAVRALTSGITWGGMGDIDAQLAGLETGANNALAKFGVTKGAGYSAADARKAVKAENVAQDAAYMREHPVQAGAMNVLGAIAAPGAGIAGRFIGKGASLGAKALRAAGVGAAGGGAYGALSAPEGERTKNALSGAAIGAVAGGATQGVLGSMAPRVISPGRSLADKVARFDEAGVRPSFAAMSPGAASLAKVAGETPLVGARTRNALQAGIADVDTSARRIGGQFGNAADRGATGEAVQTAVGDFNKRFSKRATALYDPVFDTIEQAQTQAVGKSAQDAAVRGARMGGQAVTPQAVIVPTETLGTLKAMGGRVNADGLSSIIVDPRVSKIMGALQSGAQDLRFGDLRALRTWVREAQANPELRQGIDQAGLQRLEQSLTSDITSNAERVAGPQAARRLKQADQFYRLGSERIQGALQNFVGKGGSNPKPGEATYDLIVRAASDAGGADSARLSALKKSLKPEEWGDIAATTVDRLGHPTAGAADQAFSINNFVTNFNKLSPQGKKLLFGDGELRSSLDNLVSVANDVKGVEKAANTSNTATATRAGAMGAVLLQPHLWGPAIASLAGVGTMGEVMTNPAAVRALVKVSRAPTAANIALASKVSPEMKALMTEFGNRLQLAPGAEARQFSPTMRPEATAAP